MLNQSEKMNFVFKQYKVNNFLLLEIPFNALNFSNILSYEQQIQEILKLANGNVILNMINIDSIDSKALSFIVNLHKQCLKTGGHLGLLSVQPQVMEIMELSKFTDILDFYTNENEIVERIQDTA